MPAAGPPIKGLRLAGSAPPGGRASSEGPGPRSFRQRRLFTPKSGTGRKPSMTSSATSRPASTGAAIGRMTSEPTPAARGIGAIAMIAAPSFSSTPG